MNTSDLRMHWLALAFIFLTTIFLLLEIYDVIRWPKERWQWWNLVLLVLLLFFNVTNGNFPDTKSLVPLKLQYLLMDGSAYLVGTYFPFYFYKSYGLGKLRWYAVYGTPLFVFVPFLIFEVGLYDLFDGSLMLNRQWGVVLPMVYGFIVLVLIVRLIVEKYQLTKDRRSFVEALSVWLAVTFWELLSAFPFFVLPQWLKLLIGNLGLMVVVVFLLIKHIRLSREEYELKNTPVTDTDFAEKCLKMGFSVREIQVSDLACKGYKNREIAEQLFLSEKTIETHLQKIYDKAGVRGKLALAAKLK